MTSDETKETNTWRDGNHLITESLLSWAKDVRYVKAIQSLLSSAAEPHFMGTQVASGSWYISYLLYVIMIAARKGRTLGMQATGLQFVTTGRRCIFGALVVLGVTAWVLDWWATFHDRQLDSQSEGLRGSDRQRRHQALRQQMLDRASTGSSQSTSIHSNLSSSKNLRRSFHDRIMSLFRNSIKSLRDTIREATRDGPHNLLLVHDGSTTSISLAAWISRIHLAQYLVTGKFPTLLHRVMGLEHRQENQTTAVPLQPGTHRVIALLIAIKGTVSVFRYLLKWWTMRLALYMEQRGQGIHAPTQDDDLGNDPYKITSTCAICKTTRIHPAASSSCGHVFCWPCLTHWVSSVKEACPYCRAPCRLEDILPLYSYDNASSSSS